MFWDDVYSNSELLWGEGPSALAIAAVTCLQRNRLHNDTLEILDIGCGYGRDVFYFKNNLKCRVLGVDTSEKAIDIALNKTLETKMECVNFQYCNFMALGEGEYDIIFTSHVYQLLRMDERREFRKAVARMLKPNGMLFLSTLSVRDPVHYGRGLPVPGEIFVLAFQ